MLAISSLPISDRPTFWSKVHARIAEAGLGVFTDDGLIYVVMKASARMQPFVRRKEEIFYSALGARAKRYRVVVNGPFVGLSFHDKLRAFWSSHALSSEPEGLVIAEGKTLAGRPAPQLFYIAHYAQSAPHYRFGPGPAPRDADAALGGCQPLLIDGVVQGEDEEAREQLARRCCGNVAEVQAVARPQARPSPRPSLVSKTVLAASARHQVVVVIVNPRKPTTSTTGTLTAKLMAAGFDNAVLLDGGESTLLAVDGAILARAGFEKTKVNAVGLGFTT